MKSASVPRDKWLSVVARRDGDVVDVLMFSEEVTERGIREGFELCEARRKFDAWMQRLER